MGKKKYITDVTGQKILWEHIPSLKERKEIEKEIEKEELENNPVPKCKCNKCIHYGKECEGKNFYEGGF